MTPAPSRRLGMGTDGDTHRLRLQYDAARTASLEEQGYRVIRFTNPKGMGNIDGVAETIAAVLASAPLPCPLRDGQRGR